MQELTYRFHVKTLTLNVHVCVCVCLKNRVCTEVIDVLCVCTQAPPMGTYDCCVFRDVTVPSRFSQRKVQVSWCYWAQSNPPPPTVQSLGWGGAGEVGF